MTAVVSIEIVCRAANPWNPVTHARMPPESTRHTRRHNPPTQPAEADRSQP